MDGVAAVEFRFATAEDVAGIADLVERAYRGPEANRGWTTETHLLAGPRARATDIEALVAGRDSRFLLAEATGDLIGCALVQRTGDDAYFGMFAVDPRHQAGGIGRSLLRACEDAARDLWSAQAMTMSVISLRSELIDWYARRGYQRSGTSEPFPFHETTGELRSDFELIHLTRRL